MFASLRGSVMLVLAVSVVTACTAELPGSVATVAGEATAPKTLCAVASQPAAAPDTVLALIEIPRGGRAKYEFDAVTGRLIVSRMLPASHPYPAAYGTFPCTLAGDGDPLDLILLSDADVHPGVLVPVRAIGMMRMRDRGAEDDKLIVVPIGDAREAMRADEQHALETFFRTYKGPGADVVVGPWFPADSARAQLRAAMAAALSLTP
jgi:inorganic pyrophosphatase